MANLFAMKTPSGQLNPEKLTYPVLVQPKFDGLRGVAVRQGHNDAVIFSFGGNRLWNTSFLTQEINAGPDDVVYDGEIMWPGHSMAETNGLVKRVSADQQTWKDSQELRFHPFDLLTVAEWTAKKCERPFQERLNRLLDATILCDRIKPVGVDVANDAEDLRRWYKQYLGMGFEGLMAKDPKGFYYWTRNAAWHRFKPTETADVEVIGSLEEYDISGRAKNRLGSVLVLTDKQTICKVGTGFKAGERLAWWNRNNCHVWKPMVGYGQVDISGPLQGKIIEVEFKCWTQDGAMREPAFKRLREDK